MLCVCIDVCVRNENVGGPSSLSHFIVLFLYFIYVCMFLFRDALRLTLTACGPQHPMPIQYITRSLAAQHTKFEIRSY